MVAAMLVGLLAGLVLSLILALPTMWLWDWLMPTIFSLPEITFWQAWGLLMLSSLLIRSTSGSSSSKS